MTLREIGQITLGEDDWDLEILIPELVKALRDTFTLVFRSTIRGKTHCISDRILMNLRSAVDSWLSSIQGSAQALQKLTLHTWEDSLPCHFCSFRGIPLHLLLSGTSNLPSTISYVLV
jgi:hypothetical protein